MRGLTLVLGGLNCGIYHIDNEIYGSKGISPKESFVELKLCCSVDSSNDTWLLLHVEQT